ncbi:MAG: DUF2244 domain-containing protein [Chromatiales bacterium]
MQLDCQRNPPSRRFILSPNSSLTWRQARTLLAAVAIVELTIGAGFFWSGLTLVLPFSGLEILVLVAVFYYCFRQGARREVVVVDDLHVVVQRGRRQLAHTREFQRAWVRVVLDRQPGWYPSRLMLCSHGQEFVVGEFLLEEERETLARQLNEAVARFQGAREEPKPWGEEINEQ